MAYAYIVTTITNARSESSIPIPNLGAYSNLNRARKHMFSVSNHYKRFDFKADHIGSSQRYETTPIMDEYRFSKGAEFISVRIERWKLK